MTPAPKWRARLARVPRRVAAGLGRRLPALLPDLPLPARLDALFAYYAAHHLRVDLPPRRIAAPDGTPAGFLEELSLRHAHLQVQGWTLGGRVTLAVGKVVTRVQPTIERNDVAVAFDCDANRGFRASLPVTSGTLEVTFDGAAAEARTVLRLDLPDARRVAAARAALKLRFLARLAVLAPGILAGLARGDPMLRVRVKAALDLASPEAIATLDRRWLAPAPETAGAASGPKDDAKRGPEPGQPCGVTVIMPVHDAFDVLPEALDRLARHTGPRLRLLLVEDRSTDARVRPWLRAWARAREAAPGHCVTLLENDANLGFIGSVNRALEALGPPREPVVLLNSDALVPEGWAERLLAPLAAARDVASATPMSNDAEIFSTPVICAQVPLAPGQGDAIDGVARSLAPVGPPVEVPTGVGFCMALAPRWLAEVPRLDPTFGPGYGEEVDWCRKVAARGGRHVAVPGLFVEHRGGSSFGSAKKRRLVARNNAEIARRYPDYDARVRAFVLSDPLATPRVALALAWLDSLPGLESVPVYIAHDLGGGAECALRDLLGRQSPTGAVVIRVGGVHRYRVEIVSAAGVQAIAVAADATLVALVGRLARRRIVYSCGVGAQDADRLPDLILRLADGRPVEVLFHDYFPISPSYNLLDADRVYRGVPTGAATPGPAHRYRRGDGKMVPLKRWQEGWARVLAAAERVVVFSTSSWDIVAEAFPEARDRIVVEPHALPWPVPPLSMPAEGPVTLGVLGNIGPPKGARLLQAIAAACRSDGAARLVVLGRVDPNFPLGRGAAVHGPYDRRDIGALAARYGITCWLVPSIWPETFSYTTHECAATGLPMIGFDLGAQGDVLRAVPGGVALPPPRDEAGTVRMADRIVALAADLTQAARQPARGRADLREV